MEHNRSGRTGTGHKNLLAEGLFHLIGERIVKGEYAPGTRIRDGDLAVELSVSRTPVREALQRLERIGLVIMRPSRYTEVTAETPESVAEARLFTGLQAGIVVRLACARLTEAERDQADELVAAVADSVDDPEDCSRARRRLFGFLSGRTGNPLQQSLVDEASLSLARSMRTVTYALEQRAVVVSACTNLRAALRAGDADGAELACRIMYGVV